MCKNSKKIDKRPIFSKNSTLIFTFHLTNVGATCSRSQSVFRDLQPHRAVREERDAVCREVGLESRAHDLFPVIDKDFRAEPVEDEPELQSAVVMGDQRLPLMDDRSAGAGIHAVDLEGEFGLAEVLRDAHVAASKRR